MGLIKLQQTTPNVSINHVSKLNQPFSVSKSLVPRRDSEHEEYCMLQIQTLTNLSNVYQMSHQPSNQLSY